MTLVDVHAHFHHPAGARADWAERNASRLAAGARIGITTHVASILGSWGRTSPTYFPSPADVVAGNDALLGIMAANPLLVQGYACVNPNYTEHALGEIDRCLARGMIGIKLAASRRADDVLLDPIGESARGHRVPVLQHIWQHRRREWPGQEASDGAELAALARRHREVPFILAHIGGGGDWRHTLPAVREVANIFVDLSGSGVDGGMLEACLASVGAGRLLWGCDITMETGWAKLRYLEQLLPTADLEAVRWRNAAAIFPHLRAQGAGRSEREERPAPVIRKSPGRVDVNAFLGDYPFHPVPGGTPEDLITAMDRVGTDVAWVSHLSAIFWPDPMMGNRDLYRLAESHPRLRPLPAIHPALPGWEKALSEAGEKGAPAVRADPTRSGIDPVGKEMRALAALCGVTGMPLLLAVRLEDGRQRHPDDRTVEVEPWAVRALIRSDTRVRLIVTHADRDFVEQVHFGSTPGEGSRILWDICWLWGPPEDHLPLLLRTVGVERFVFGTGMPLRIPEASVAKLDLLDLTADQRQSIESGNLNR